MARIRSPNYPQISLPAAIERARAIYKAERQNRIDRDVAVKLMGFGGYNGASAGVLSALLKFGLLEPLGDKEMKISKLAERLLVPHDDSEWAAAVNEAAANPPLFVELSERWPDNRPSEPSLRTYLTRRGFADSALDSVIRSYMDTMNLVRDAAAQPAAPRDADSAEDVDGDEVGREDPPVGAQHNSQTAREKELVVGPGLNIVPTGKGYAILLSGSVTTQEHVEQVVSMLTALKPSLPPKEEQ